jgi:hypothetical protein
MESKAHPPRRSLVIRPSPIGEGSAVANSAAQPLHRKKTLTPSAVGKSGDYQGLLGSISALLDTARHASVRSVNAIMTAAYWETGRRVVEYEQGGKRRAEYGEALLQHLSMDLTGRHGRGFSVDNLQNMRLFYQAFPPARIYETLSRKSLLSAPVGDQKYETLSRKLQLCQTTSENSETLSQKLPMDQTQFGLFTLAGLATAFPLSWSHYVLLLKARSPEARAFYEDEALRCGWPVRTLDRQMSTLFYERTALSRDKAAMLRKSAKARPGEELTPTEAVKDPLILCSSKGDDVAKYALENLPNQVLAAEYRITLPSEKQLLDELRQTRRAWELRRLARPAGTRRKP